MKTRKFLSFFLILVLLLSLSGAAFAEVGLSSDESALSGEHDATVFLAGSSPVSEAKVRGILFTAGNTVNVGGESEYAFIAGNVIAFTGANSRDAFIAGNSLSLGGSVGRDLLALGNSVNISGSVGRDVMAAGKTVFITGDIGGNLLLNADEIQIASGVGIGGTLRYNADARVTAPADILGAASTYSAEEDSALFSEIMSMGENFPAPETAPAAESTPAGGDAPAETSAPVVTSAPIVTNTPMPASAPQDEHHESRESSGPSAFGRVKFFLYPCVGLVLIAFALLWLTPLWERVDRDYTGADFSKYAAAFGIGFGVVVGLPIAAIILMITGFGLRPAIVLLGLYIAAFNAAPIFLGFILGSLLWRRLCKRPANYWAELPIGIVVWRILRLIPVVKLAVALVTVPFGIGVLAKLLGKKKAAPAAPVLPEKTEA